MKILVNAITASRIVGSIALLIIGWGTERMEYLPLSFFIVYCWCILSDLIDGPISRKTNTTSNFGALFDSLADVAMIAASLVVFVPMFPADQGFGPWIFYVIGFVVLIRISSMIIGLVKYKAVTLLHTYSSKGAALIMVTFPILWISFGSVAPAFLIIASAQFVASAEEFVINIYSKELDRNVKGIFDAMKRKRAA